jgi:hypothetical protein
MYNIADFTDEDLYNVLEVTNPSDGELEARIIQMLQRHMNAETANGHQLYQFFLDMYKHFFNTDGKEQIKQDEPDKPDKPDKPEKSETDEIKLDYTKELEFAPGKINPLLKETYTRTISIDSQYREPEYPFSTDFTVNFNETLKDVVSMKLYAVQIPITWYTISNSFGSNFFLLVPQLVEDGEFNTLGLYDKAFHRYKLRIEAGNYSAEDLVNTIKSELKELAITHTDVSFGNTTIEYNKNTTKATFKFDIQKIYNEFSYDVSYGPITKQILGISSGYNPSSLTSITTPVGDVDQNTKVPVRGPKNDPISYYTLTLKQYAFDQIPSQLNSLPTVAPIDTITITFDVSESRTYSEWADSMTATLRNHPKLTSNTSSVKKVTINGKIHYETNITPDRSKTKTVEGGKWILIRDTNAKIMKAFVPERYTLLGSQPGNTDISSTAVYTIIESEEELITFRPIYDVLGGVYIDPLVYPNDDYTTRNDIVLKIPPGSYTVKTFLVALKLLFDGNSRVYGTDIRMGDTGGSNSNKIVAYYNVNKIYTTRDYSVVFYDVESFSKCTNSSASYTNATMDSTLGYILGFHALQTYDFSTSSKIVGDNMGKEYYQNPRTLLSTGSDYTYNDSSEVVGSSNVSRTIVTLRGDTVVNIYLYTYFMIILDDFNQNHLNDGLVTLSKRDYSVTLPSYANRKTVKQCNPLTNTSSSSSSSSSSLIVNDNNNNNFNNLTQNQIYSVEQILAQQGKPNDNFNRGVYVKDMFALLPVKTTGMQPGSILVEVGGQLQMQERIYFGPVNIRRLAVKLVNDKGDIVDLNGGNWSFQLVCVQLYQRGG